MTNVPVSTGNNRVNNSGNLAATGPLSRTSIIYPLVIPANAVVPCPAAGSMFYVTVTTSPIGVDIAPLNGVFNRYGPGKGMKVRDANQFPSLQVRNPNNFAIVVQLFVGFDEFIDNTLILQQTGQTLIAKPTYPVASAAAVVDIDDISGAEFQDINGGRWFALSRDAVFIFNLDAGVTLLLQEENSIVANGPAIAVVLPQTSLRFPSSGNFCLNVGGGMINAIVSETYQAIPAVPVSI